MNAQTYIRSGVNNALGHAAGSQGHLPSEVLSECLVTQKVLLVLGGNDGSPVFTLIPIGNIRTHRGGYPQVLEVSRGLRIAHLSSSALHRSLHVFAARYGSCAYLLGKLMDIISDCRGCCDTKYPHKPVAPSLSSLIKEGTSSCDPLGYGRYNWNWTTGSEGLVDALNTLWTEWNIILSDVHHRFVSSLHKEFSGMQAIPLDGGNNDIINDINKNNNDDDKSNINKNNNDNSIKNNNDNINKNKNITSNINNNCQNKNNNDMMPMLRSSQKDTAPCSPFMHLYHERFDKYATLRGDAIDGSKDSGLLDFKLTLSNIEHHLHPFLTMLEGVTNMLELLLSYMDRYMLGIGSMGRVAVMLLMLHLRSCEHGQSSVSIRQLWKFMLYKTLQSFSVIPSTYVPTKEGVRPDKSWTYLGGAQVIDLMGVRETLPTSCVSMPTFSEQVLSPSAALDAVYDTEQHVLKCLNDGVVRCLNVTVQMLRDVLREKYHFIPYLSYLSGLCCLRFGDCLDPVFAVVTRWCHHHHHHHRLLPLDYHARVKGLLHECLMDIKRFDVGNELSSLSDTELVSIVSSFDYEIDAAITAPNLSLKMSRDHDHHPNGDRHSAFLTGALMRKYSRILCHLLEFQAFYADVKAMAALSCRSSGIVCGFFVPRASLPLLHVATALDEYYRWLVNAAWSTLSFQLDRCRCMPEMVVLHEKYVDFLLESLLVPVPIHGDKDVSGLGISSLFSEPLGLIRKGASELLRVFRDPFEVTLDDIEAMNAVLSSEVSRLKSTLNVVCSFVLHDVPVFGSAERAILSDVVGARIDLTSGSCKALSVLQRLLR